MTHDSKTLLHHHCSNHPYPLLNGRCYYQSYFHSCCTTHPMNHHHLATQQSELLLMHHSLECLIRTTLSLNHQIQLLKNSDFIYRVLTYMNIRTLVLFGQMIFLTQTYLLYTFMIQLMPYSIHPLHLQTHLHRPIRAFVSTVCSSNL